MLLQPLFPANVAQGTETLEQQKFWNLKCQTIKGSNYLQLLVCENIRQYHISKLQQTEQVKNKELYKIRNKTLLCLWNQKSYKSQIEGCNWYSNLIFPMSHNESSLWFSNILLGKRNSTGERHFRFYSRSNLTSLSWKISI